MKKLFFLLVLAFALLQFFQIDKTNPPVDKNMDFLTIKKTPEDVAQLIKTSCYDCHSNESTYPWYTNIQPFGWLVKDHIEEGRKELNFSTFATYEPLRQAKKLKKSAHEIEEGKMPLESYLLLHLLVLWLCLSIEGYFFHRIYNLPEVLGTPFYWVSVPILLW